MIKYTLMLIFLSLSINVVSQVEEGVKYSDNIIDQNLLIQESIVNLIASFEQFIPEKMEAVI